MNVSKLKAAWSKYGRKGTIRVLREALETDTGAHKLDANDFSFQELWHEFVGPIKETLGIHGAGFMLREDAVDSTAFADITGVLIASKLIEGYNQPGFIGDQMVTVMSSKRKDERYAGFTDIAQPLEVPEGMPYEETGFGDKYSTGEAFKKGRLLNITEEAITFDQTGQILVKAMELGEKCRLERENTILNGFMDTANTVFKPQGAAEALYRLAAGANSNTINRIAANALQDWTDIDNVMQIFAGMTDSRGDRIQINPRFLIVPWALQATANRIVSATQIRTTTGTTETIAGNPVTGLSVLSSSQFDTDSTTQWYLGDPKKQMIWQEIWPLQVARKRLEKDAHERDIVASYKCRYFGGIAAIDDKYVVQSAAV